METAFSSTPRTNDDVMRPSSRDGLASARRVVVDRLLDPNGAQLVARERDQAQQRLARLLQGFGMLTTQPKAIISRPDPELDAGAAAVWDYLQQTREGLTKAPESFDAVVRTLRSVPYGIGERVIPLILVAALRQDIRAGNIILERSAKNREWQPRNMDGASLDDAVSDPTNHRLRYVNVTEAQFMAVEGLLVAVAGQAAVPAIRSHLLDETKQHVQRRWSRTPNYCQNTDALDDRARRLRDLILRPLVHPDSNAHRILVEELRGLVDTTKPLTRDQYAEALGGPIAHIQTAVDGMPAIVARDLGNTLGWGPDLGAMDVVARLAEWYQQLRQPTRDHCHAHDAGKLQGWLRTAGTPDLEELCAATMGRPLKDWSDGDSGHFVGRVQAAREALQAWAPEPSRSPTSVEAAPGMATLGVNATYRDSKLELTRQFPTIEADGLSETAKVFLRLLTSNLADDHSLRDGERENLILELIKRVFGDA